MVGDHHNPGTNRTEGLVKHPASGWVWGCLLALGMTQAGCDALSPRPLSSRDVPGSTAPPLCQPLWSNAQGIQPVAAQLPAPETLPKPEPAELPAPRNLPEVAAG